MNELVINLIAVLASLIVAYLLFFIETKRKDMLTKTDNELYKKYINQVSETISSVVTKTNQTYVEALKAKNEFDLDAQKVALQATYDEIYSLLTAESKLYLEDVTTDIPLYLMAQIEAEVNKQK